MNSVLKFLRDYLDKPANFLFGWTGVWSSHGGNIHETISSTLGAEECENLYKLWKAGIPLQSITEDDIQDPITEHPLEEFSSDLCNCFQKYHAPRSIEWEHEAWLEQKYPGIRDVLTQWLVLKGVK